MLRVLKSLLVFLIVAAFGVATASPCVSHHIEMTSADQLGAKCRPVAAEFIKHSAPHHETDGECVHPCCIASATAALAEVLRPYVAPRVTHTSFPILGDHLRTGIAIAPLTGPPKLSA
jgi:hypothetical protein